jgi:hypothetical protein
MLGSLCEIVMYIGQAPSRHAVEVFFCGTLGQCLGSMVMMQLFIKHAGCYKALLQTTKQRQQFRSHENKCEDATAEIVAESTLLLALLTDWSFGAVLGGSLVL